MHTTCVSHLTDSYEHLKGGGLQERVKQDMDKPHNDARAKQPNVEGEYVQELTTKQIRISIIGL
jgi:hypothetical protein